MKAFHILCVATVLSGAVVLGMEIEKKEQPFRSVFQREQSLEFNRIVENSRGDFGAMVPQIRNLEKKNWQWETILGSKSHIEILLHKINFGLKFDNKIIKDSEELLYNQGEHLRFEIAAALLATPGAIKYGIEFIKQDSAKENLIDYLFRVVRSGSNERGFNNSLLWQDQDWDTVKAALDMGLSPDIRKKNPWMNFREESLLFVAIHSDKIKVVKELIERGAELNVVDDNKRTPLTLAVSDGHPDIVEILLETKKIDVSLPDGCNETPVQCLKYLEDGSKRRQKAYFLILKLLRNAGAITAF